MIKRKNEERRHSVSDLLKDDDREEKGHKKGEIKKENKERAIRR